MQDIVGTHTVDITTPYQCRKLGTMINHLKCSGTLLVTIMSKMVIAVAATAASWHVGNQVVKPNTLLMMTFLAIV